MSTNRAAILEKAIQVESLLADLGGEGRGIHDKLTCIEHEFEVSMVKKIRRVASIRNKAAHEIDFDTDMVSFHRVADEVIDCLESKIAAKRSFYRQQRQSSQQHHNSQQSSYQGPKASQQEGKKTGKSWSSWGEMDWKERSKLVAGGALVVGLLILGSS
jgi:hypothetical protein